ncbi:vacuolar amino acid transporter 1-like, partial [Trifolium medium]|nr:vacuolar amino acid transporter 1-like [Trifolium medium]
MIMMMKIMIAMKQNNLNLSLLINGLKVTSIEAIDPLTIAAAPNLGSIFKAPSVIYSSFVNLGSKSNLDLHDGKTPFLSNAQIPEGVPRQSTWWEKASIQMHFPEELPIGYGCTFTQTIFN